MSAERAHVLRLNDRALESVVAHGGTGRIGFRRLLDSLAFRSPCNFVDYAVLPPGASIGVHSHVGNEEIYLVLEGCGVMHLDGEEVEVQAGHVVVNRDGGTHGLRNNSNADLRLFVVEIATPEGARR